MKTFLEFNPREYGFKEPRRKNITVAEAQRILNTECLQTVQYIHQNNTHLIFRGVGGRWGGKPSLKIITPSQFERTSRNTENYYTWIMDNDPIWKKFPKRSKSIVCSTDASYADSYGILHCVIPFDGAKIATAGSHDIWNTFSFNFQWDAERVNTSIRSIFKTLMIAEPTSYIEFVKACHAVDTIVKEKGLSVVLSMTRDTVSRKILEKLEYDPTVEPLYRTVVRKVFFPRDGMHVGAYDDPRLWADRASAGRASAGGELWTDSDAILIPISSDAKESETFYEDFVARIWMIRIDGVDSFMDTEVD